eukprot:7852674-Heterocapsa_arctica.AAC.1
MESFQRTVSHQVLLVPSQLPPEDAQLLPAAAPTAAPTPLKAVGASWAASAIRPRPSPKAGPSAAHYSDDDLAEATAARPRRPKTCVEKVGRAAPARRRPREPTAQPRAPARMPCVKGPAALELYAGCARLTAALDR